MDNVKPKKREDQSENEKYISTKLPTQITVEGEKCNEKYFDELCGPPSRKRPKNVKHSNAYDRILDTSKDKKRFFDNIDFRNNSTELCFDLTLNIDPSHTSSLQEYKLGKVIARNHEKLSHTDRVVKSNSIKKKEGQEIRFPHTDNFFTIQFEKDSTYEMLENEKKALVELCGRILEVKLLDQREKYQRLH